MPSFSIKLIPGVNTDKTPSLNEAGISSSNMIRFREGLTEKRGGWTSFLSSTVAVVPRALWPWRDFSGKTWVAIGSTNSLSTIQNSTALDISPRQVLSNLQNCFTYLGQSNTNNASEVVQQAAIKVTDANHNPISFESLFIEDLVSVAGIPLSGPYTALIITGPTTYNLIAVGYTGTSGSNVCNIPTYTTTAGSTTVSVSLTGHGVAVGYQYGIINPVVVGGLTLTGSQTVASVIDANTFTIQASGPAASSGSQLANGGYVTIKYFPKQTFGTAKTGSIVPAVDWSLGNYGKLLIACAVGGNIYEWDPSGNASVASPVPNSPQASGIVISDAAQQIIAYGGNPNSLYDPNYVAWCDTGNPNAWTAAIGNQAGSYRIPTGSAIIGAATVASSLILLWTDVDVWAMQYVGYPIVYGFTKLAMGCGLIGQFAWAKLGGMTYWMSQNKFWAFDGSSVQPMDCPVYDNVFPILSKANTWKIRGGSNAAFGEVMWFFPSTSGSGENDMYVCYNPAEGTWDYGSMPRSAWVDQSVAGLPIGADPSGNVYQHETSPDAAGSALSWSFTTGLAQVSEGEELAFVDRIRPDFKFPQGAGTVQVSVLTYKYPGDAPVIKGPYNFTQATEYITTRCRGRYVAMKFSGSDLGSFWRIGRTQYRYAPDGRR